MRDYARLSDELYEDLRREAPDLGAPITSDMGPRSAACVSLASSFFKKLAASGNSASADTAALNKFLAINSVLDGRSDFAAESEVESVFLDYLRDNLRVTLDSYEGLADFDLDYIRQHMNVGPGSSQKNSDVNMIDKLFHSSLSYANEMLIPWYRAALAETGYWADAEMHRYQEYGFTKVHGGKIFFAVKNADISRTCCTEATLETLIQKAICAFLEERLERFFGINLSNQSKFNRELARIGSVYGTIGTMDLVSASDCMSMRRLQADFPNTFLKGMIRAARCEFAVLPDGSKVKLSMVSTMGNSFTFPLQTLYFACAVKAVYQAMGLPCQDPRSDFGVFGDDICVRKEAFDFLAKMLTKLGFEVNGLKSFNTGPFRESCGGDYFNGFDIRGVYIRSLESQQDIYSAINRLLRWSSAHEVPLPRTIKLLRSWLPAKLLLVPFSEAMDSGLAVPFKLTSPRLNDSYWFKYRVKVRRLKKKRFEDDTDGNSPLEVAIGYLSGYLRRPDVSICNPNMSFWDKNPSAQVSKRDRPGEMRRYQVVTKTIPYWDWYPDPKTDTVLIDGEWRTGGDPGSYSRWESTVVAHSEFLGME